MDLSFNCIPNLMEFKTTYEWPQAAKKIISDQEGYNINCRMS